MEVGLKLVAYLVVVAFGRVASDEFADKACEEELSADYDSRQGKVEVDRVGDIEVVVVREDADAFKREHYHYSDEA